MSANELPEPLFRIRDLDCSYNKTGSVLKIENLNIPRSKLVVILGASGSGKSTILELLGLMNNTFRNGSSIDFFPVENGKGYNYQKLWDEKNEMTLESIRKQHFSFIFQETNLMQNFTAYENVCLSQMIQGISWEQALANSMGNMKNVNLGELSLDCKANALSGGQKQRLAFVRAVTPEYTVLFGDEPTGNLDEKTSIDLLRVLRNDVDTKNVTVIIVSHNIELSIKFADLLMVITKKNGYGIINEEQVFEAYKLNGSKRWKDNQGNIIHDMSEKIRGYL